MSELGKHVIRGAPTKRGNILACGDGHPMYVAIDDINPGDGNTWGPKLVRCDGGCQPQVGSEDWATCARCGASLASALWPVARP